MTGESVNKDWWMGQVILCSGSARDPKLHNLFQIAVGGNGGS
ncbi:DUF3104 domain-containing protein [Synechococcus sp. UW179A]|nr:DUF3104 domain-containing protein [Synechococcus sp. UW179A]